VPLWPVFLCVIHVRSAFGFIYRNLKLRLNDLGDGGVVLLVFFGLVVYDDVLLLARFMLDDNCVVFEVIPLYPFLFFCSYLFFLATTSP
jgi:hypothetical protein